MQQSITVFGNSFTTTIFKKQILTLYCTRHILNVRIVLFCVWFCNGVLLYTTINIAHQS